MEKLIAREMGLQITCGICAKISKKGIIWKIPGPSWQNIARIVPPTGSGVVGRASDARPRPYVFKRCAEVQYSVRHWVSEGQECRFDPSYGAEKETRLRVALLSQGILRQHCWIG